MKRGHGLSGVGGSGAPTHTGNEAGAGDMQPIPPAGPHARRQSPPHHSLAARPGGQPYNVAQAYARAADALRGKGSFDVDFDLAVRRHKLIDAVERSSATGRSVKLDS